MRHPVHCGKELGRGSGGTAVAGMSYLVKFHGGLKCQKAGVNFFLISPPTSL